MTFFEQFRAVPRILVGIGKSMSVAFRSAKERHFRGAKGDYATVIDSPVLGCLVLGTAITIWALAACAAAPYGTGVALTFSPIPTEQRVVGLAYSTWHTSPTWNNTWGTPELGGYTSTDRAVIRKHAEWLADAGVDFTWIDWSNNVHFDPKLPHRRGVFDTIEESTTASFEEYVKLPRHPRISIFLGTGTPESLTSGNLQRKADQVYADYVANKRFRPLVQDYLGKPLLVVYVNTPSPFPHGVPEWNDPRFTVRWMTGYVTEQPNLRTADLVSKYGYWSWEDRGKQTFSMYDGHPEAMVVVASWREDKGGGIPAGGRRNGETFRRQWARAREIGPRFAMVVSWNELRAPDVSRQASQER